MYRFSYKIVKTSPLVTAFVAIDTNQQRVGGFLIKF